MPGVTFEDGSIGQHVCKGAHHMLHGMILPVLPSLLLCPAIPPRVAGIVVVKGCEMARHHGPQVRDSMP